MNWGGLANSNHIISVKVPAGEQLLGLLTRVVCRRLAPADHRAFDLIDAAVIGVDPHGAAKGGQQG